MPPPSTKDQAKTYDAVCPRLRPLCGWVSYGWSTKAQADMRLSEHEEEHRTGEAAPEMVFSEALLSELSPEEITMRLAIHDGTDG